MIKANMRKTIYFTEKEIEELKWIVPMYMNLHEDTWDEEEKKIVSNIIKKIDKFEQKFKNQSFI